MKVLLVSPLPPPNGGIATWTEKYLSNSRNFEVDIVNTAVLGKRAINFSGKKALISEIRRTIKVFSNVWKKSRNAVDIVHINTSCSPTGLMRDLLCMMIVPKCSRLILHCHCTVEDQLGRSKLGKCIFKKAANKADCVLVLNDMSQKYVQGVSKTPCIKIPNFIDEVFLRLDAKEIRGEISKVLFTGHVLKSKGIEELLEAAQSFPEIEFIVAGIVSDDFKDCLLPSNVKMIGSKNREEIRCLLDDADVFLFPSYTEGFSNSILEAMARGVPVIASDVGANRDMVEASGGIVIPSRNADAIVWAMKSLFERSKREEASRWCVEKVAKEYLFNPVLCQLEGIYKSLLKENT